MAKIKLAQLDNSGKPTGHEQEYDEEQARRMLRNKKPVWKEVQSSSKSFSTDEATKSKSKS